MTVNTKITGMQLLDHERDGGGIVASFTAIIDDALRLNSCSILRKPDGYLQVLTPQGKRSDRAVDFMDGGAHRGFREKAIVMYRLMTGEDDAVVTANAREPADEPDDAGVRRFLSAEQEACEIAGL